MITIIKGQTVKINSIVYTDQDRNLRANIAAATISVMFKKAYSDPDSAKLFEKTVGSGVTITSAVDGEMQTVITAAETNALSYNKIYFEITVKLSDGTTYIRTGVEEVIVKPNVLKTLN